MNGIAGRFGRTAIGFVAAGAIAVALAGPALASHARVRISVPTDVAVGETVHMPVTLQALDGAPLKGITLTFYLHAVFAGVVGEAEIGRAVTDESGVATLAYKPRLAGHHQLRIEYATSDGSEIEVVTTAFDVGGGTQIHSPAAGLEVPGLNVGLLMAVLATVWSILFWVALRLVAIARAGGESGPLGLDQTR